MKKEEMTMSSAPSWKAPHLVAASTRRNLLVFVGLLLLVVLLSVYESLLIKPAVDQVVKNADLVSYLVSLMLSLAAAVLMMESGYHARKAHIDGVRISVSRALVAGWALIGLGLALLRLLPEPQVVSLLDDLNAPTTDDGLGRRLLVAGVMLLVYVGAGILNNATGRSLFNPVAQAHASARRSRARLERRIAKRRARVALAFERLEVARGDLAAVPKLRTSAEQSVDAYFEELRQSARLRMLLPLGDPSITSAVAEDPRGDDGSAPQLQAVL